MNKFDKAVMAIALALLTRPVFMVSAPPAMTDSNLIQLPNPTTVVYEMIPAGRVPAKSPRPTKYTAPIDKAKNTDYWLEETNFIEFDPQINGVSVTEDDIYLLALLTMAEAEGECEYGKRLVIDTVLNRVDSGYFPDTISGVIYQPGQFTSMWNGRVDRCYVPDSVLQLVREELVNRTNYDVCFFTSVGYSAYGTPLFQVENHYFSSYD